MTTVVIYLRNHGAWNRVGVMGMEKSRKVQKILEESKIERLGWEGVGRKIPRLWPTGWWCCWLRWRTEVGT